MSKLLVTGYYGCGNLGDDAILLGLLELLSGKGYEVAATSGNPEETSRMYGIRAVPRKDLKAVGQEIEASDALVFGGGSIFQDVTSVRSVAFYANLIRMAKKARKKVVLLAQGIGPLNTFLGKRLATQAFNQCDAIAVRDPASVGTLKDLGVKVAPRVVGDLAFLLPKPTVAEDVSNYQVGEMRTIGISPRPFGKSRDVVGVFSELCRMLFQSNHLPVLIEMDREEDGPLILEIEKQVGGKVPSLRKLTTPMQIQQRAIRMEGVVAMRLHAGVLAATAGVPAFMVSYDPKVAAFAKTMDLPAIPAGSGMTAQRICDGLMDFLKRRDSVCKNLGKRVEEQKELARANLQVLQDCVQP